MLEHSSNLGRPERPTRKPALSTLIYSQLCGVPSSAIHAHPDPKDWVLLRREAAAWLQFLTAPRKTRRENPALAVTGRSNHTKRALLWTTDVLTTTTLVYACGVGITAAAGTKLSLHLLLSFAFTEKPLQTPKSTFPQSGKSLFLFTTSLGQN